MSIKKEKNNNIVLFKHVCIFRKYSFKKQIVKSTEHEEIFQYSIKKKKHI